MALKYKTFWYLIISFMPKSKLGYKDDVSKFDAVLFHNTGMLKC